MSFSETSSRAPRWRRRFFTIWTGQAASLLTSSVVQYALIWYLTEKTGSAAVLSWASLVGFLPMALFSPWIGGLVDRMDRKKIMIAADGAIALVSMWLVIAGWNGELSVGVILAALFLRALGSAFHQPCLQAATPLIVPEDQIAKSGGYTFTFQSVSQIASPALAAALFAALPISRVILVDLIGAAAGIFTLLPFELPSACARKEKLHMLSDAKEGFRVLRAHKGIYLLVYLSALFSLAYVPVASLYPLLTTSYFLGDAWKIGLVEMLFSMGMLLGGLIIGVWGGTKDKMRTMAPAILVMGLALMGIGLLPASGFGFFCFAFLTFLTGLAAPFFTTLFMALIQQRIAPEYLGRALGVSTSLMSLACPLGLALSGAMAEKVGLLTWFLISGVVTLVCAALCMLLPSIRRVDRQIIKQGEPREA